MNAPAEHGGCAEALDLSDLPPGGIFGPPALTPEERRASETHRRNKAAGIMARDDAAHAREIVTAQREAEGKADRASPVPLGVCLADVPAEAIRWAWPGWLALGKLHVFDGNPGMGKSTLLCALAASVTTGSAWPDGSPVPTAAHGSVMILTAEDDPATTIRPRMEAAEADVSRVHVVSTIPTVPTTANPSGAGRLPTLPADVPLLVAECVRIGVRLLIIDPVTAYLGDVNSHRDSDVRGALAPLATAAEEAGIAVVLVRHLNKGLGGDAMMRGGGSIAFAGLARVVWIVGTDPNDAEARALAVSKNNLAAFPKSIGYALESAGPFGVGRVVWRGPVGLTANDLVRPPAEPTTSPAQAAAEAFLLDALADGPRLSSSIIDAGKAAGIAETTLKRARYRLNIEAERRGFGKDGGWFWLPPASARPSASAESSNGATVSTVGPVARNDAPAPESQGVFALHDTEIPKDANPVAPFGGWPSMGGVAPFDGHPDGHLGDGFPDAAPDPF